MHREKANRSTPDCSGLDAALRDACARADAAAHPLAIMFQLYRSVRELTDALMQARVDAGLPPTLDDGLAVLLDKVLDSVSELARDPKLPVRQALVVQRTIRSLAATAQRARGPRVVAGEQQRGQIAMRP